MQIQDIANTSFNQDTSQVRESKSQLGKDEFMEILVAQLKNQDPLSPMEDKDFIAQMAQFSTLEQMQELNSKTLFAQATSLIGKDIYSTISGDNGIIQEVFGKVTSAQTINGIPYLEVGEKLIPYTTDIIVYAGSENQG